MDLEMKIDKERFTSFIRKEKFKGFFWHLRKFMYKAWIYNCIFFTKEVIMRFAQSPNKNGWGKVSLWMFFVYANLAWIDDIVIYKMWKKRWPWLVQVLIIETLLYFFEFIYGVFFKYGLGILAWDYSHHTIFGIKCNAMGIISLKFFIPWFVISFFILFLYPRLKVSIEGNIGNNYNMFQSFTRRSQ